MLGSLSARCFPVLQVQVKNGASPSLRAKALTACALQEIAHLCARFSEVSPEGAWSRYAPIVCVGVGEIVFDVVMHNVCEQCAFAG